VLLIEHLGAPHEEEVERILTPGHVPDEPGNSIQALWTEPHLFIAQTLQEISRHLHMQPLMVQHEEVDGIHGSPPEGKHFAYREGFPARSSCDVTSGGPVASPDLFCAAHGGAPRSPATS
jgi:hypothetical protein